MIRFTEDKEQIIKCWKQAFGDSDEDILFFIDNAKNASCLAYYDNDTVASMLYLVKCNLGYYIYAACTLQEYRSRGYMTRLLDYAKADYCPVCLIPAEQWLVDYYSKRGFEHKIEIDSIEFDEAEEIKEYLFEGCKLDKPFALICKGD